ncbi:voltage-dependent calcium channel beta subunit-associated regulatory protein isoform X2 [Camelus ferus]|uniref:Voltage-dependent calcium channel beta subunit-associated regulatory protein isoform X2 n=1 Tax=Camelus ferus TaxID=419612 RepID=A0A8B8RXH7_CAMFR|nr:voltage-dependent calcium channel beta subunit-associated regulatory protein isoform X2 [Camelus ferus]
MEEVWDGSCFVGPRGDEEFATGKEVTEAREGLLPLSEESPAGPAPPSAKALRLDWAFRFHWRRKGCHFAMLSTGLDRLGWDPDKAPPPSLKMQPTATMATAVTTPATVALTTTWDNVTGRPTTEPDPILDNSVLLVVVMALFVGGTLVVLSGVLLLCRRCWEVHRRLHRAPEEAEKTTTTYLDSGTHPAPDPDFRGEDPEGQDAETERFLSTGSTGRRVSFNEAALFEQSRKARDKGRRYTLTEGDFHHLKNARLTHLHLPPLKIVTIHECDSGEASATTTPHPTAAPKASFAIFQPPGKALTGRSVGPSSALPGDPYNSAVGPADFEISPSASSDSGEGTSLDAAVRSAKPGGPGVAAGPGEAGPGSGAGPVLQFFTRLRRHASLDGASPYFKVKKWKLEPSQRASSLDTRGLGAGQEEDPGLHAVPQ